MWMRFIYETFSLSGWIFMVITLPAVLAFSLLMIISNRREQIKACGKEAVLIPSGGQGGSEPMPEAEAMGRYLRECGIPERAILQEDQSRNTYQNMAFSKKLIEEREGGVRCSEECGAGGAADSSAGGTVGCADDKNVIFVTTNYHVFRSGVWAGLAGLRAEGLGSKTKWWFWPNAFVRECVGLLANRIVPEAVCLVILIAVFGGIATLIV